MTSPLINTFAQKMDQTVPTGSPAGKRPHHCPNAPQQKIKLSRGMLTVLLTSTRAHWAFLVTCLTLDFGHFPNTTTCSLICKNTTIYGISVVRKSYEKSRKLTIMRNWPKSSLRGVHNSSGVCKCWRSEPFAALRPLASLWVTNWWDMGPASGLPVSLQQGG